jgi:hypothetical protein
LFAQGLGAWSKRGRKDKELKRLRDRLQEILEKQMAERGRRVKRAVAGVKVTGER